MTRDEELSIKLLLLCTNDKGIHFSEIWEDQDLSSVEGKKVGDFLKEKGYIIPMFGNRYRIDGSGELYLERLIAQRDKEELDRIRNENDAELDRQHKTVSIRKAKRDLRIAIPAFVISVIAVLVTSYKVFNDIGLTKKIDRLQTQQEQILQSMKQLKERQDSLVHHIKTK